MTNRSTRPPLSRKYFSGAELPEAAVVRWTRTKLAGLFSTIIYSAQKCRFRSQEVRENRCHFILLITRLCPRPLRYSRTS